MLIDSVVPAGIDMEYDTVIPPVLKPMGNPQSPILLIGAGFQPEPKLAAGFVAANADSAEL
ncbi:hypothetical protein JCM16161A_16780 [Vulcanisaeta sp. JCM 16161]